MTITNGYTTLSQLKAKLGISDSTDDTMLENIVEAVSRWIDNYTGRVFYASTTGEVRYYTPITWQMCPTDDIVSITSVKVDNGTRVYGTTLATTDYDTIPDNAALRNLPIMGLRISPASSQSFPATVELSVKVTGSFGVSTTGVWAEVLREACEIQCSRIYKRKDAPFGVAGTAPTGQVALIAELDPDVKAMLAPPIRRVYRL